VLLSNIPKRFIVKGEDGFEDLFTAGPTAKRAKLVFVDF
jgi:hypothetical protein